MVNKFIVSLVFFFFLQSLSFNTFAEDKKLNISPIVQVISYFDVYGKHPKMMGWGSASIINDKGVIISNDHVVDDGKGALASAFSICITKDINQKPDCDYTASLIARDDKLDVSILKIDPVDIYGKAVDYKSFKTIDIDFDYTPKNQDETIAIGYPWIGADTISETKGIVSGLTDYNGYKYIKTDTLIAGGNSGGAFIKDGKLIGIPTFGMGGWGEGTLGYALSIKEAKSFIEENINKESTKNKVTEIIDFNGYRSIIEGINSNFGLKDDIFDIKFPSDYEVLNYEENKTVELALKKQKDTGVTSLSLYVEKIPKLDTQRKVFYYLESIGFYSKDWQKLLKKNIGGLDFYYPVDKTDLSNGDSYWGNSYKAILDGYTITLQLQAPLYDEKRNKEVKLEIEKVLSGIKLNKDNVSKSSNSFSTNIPKIEINSITGSIGDTGRYKFYLSSNLFEYVDINLNELIEYNGKGKTVDEIYNVQLKDLDSSEKAKIKFKGLDGYITCSDKVQNYNFYNYYSYYGYYNGGMGINSDEFGNPIDTKSCQINIFFPLDKELNRQNYLSIDVKSQTSNIQDNLDKAISFLTKNLNVESKDNEVKIPNLFKEQIKLNFTDINKQSTTYKNFLKLLVRYGVIENGTKFEGSKAITWGEYLDLYTKWVYNFDLPMVKCSENDNSCKYSKYKIYTVDINGKKVNLDSIFKDLGIDYNEYVNINDAKVNYSNHSSNQYKSSEEMQGYSNNITLNLTNFEKLFMYKLAGINIGDLNEENIYLFENMSNEKQYILEQKKINDLNNRIYGSKKILISDFYSNYSTTFNSSKENRYYFITNELKQVDKFQKDKLSFGNKQNELFNLQKEISNLEKDYVCSKKPNYTEFAKCYNNMIVKIKSIQEKYKNISEQMSNGSLSYYVALTKAQALEQIFTQVDFGLFDKELAKKKDTQIEE